MLFCYITLKPLIPKLAKHTAVPLLHHRLSLHTETAKAHHKTTCQTWCISKKLSRSASELITRLRSWADIKAAIHEKNSRTSSVESLSCGGTKCCQSSFLSTNSSAHSGIHLYTHIISIPLSSFILLKTATHLCILLTSHYYYFYYYKHYTKSENAILR